MNDKISFMIPWYRSEHTILVGLAQPSRFFKQPLIGFLEKEGIPIWP